jgi:hypothetical protein
MMKRKINIYTILIVATVVLIGCKKNNSVTTFEVKNFSDEIIYVNYTTYETMDTTIKVIGVDLGAEIFVNQSESGYNWYYDYGIQINSILNTTGDTISFNPNLSQYWTISSDNEGRRYFLGISNGSF